MLTGSNVSMDVVVKHFTTSLENVEAGRPISPIVYRPVSFETFGFNLHRQNLGAKLSGSRLEWVPQLDALISTFSTFNQNEESDK
jgi:hypothetical protein